MRIAINLFSLSNIGGIHSYMIILEHYIRKLGHDVHIHYLMKSNRDGINKLSIGGKKFYGYQMDYRNIKEYRNYMKKYDGIIFMHPGLTKRVMSKEGSDFLKCYDINRPKVVILHDQFMEERWGYLQDIDVDYVVASKEPDRRYLKKCYKHPERIKMIHWGIAGVEKDNFKEIVLGYLKRKIPLLLSMSQWRSWKNVPYVLRMTPYINGEVEFYNDGIEYHTYKRGDYFGDKKDKYWERAMSTNGRFVKNITNYKECLQCYKNAMGLFDLSYVRDRTGLYNMTTTEAMRYACVPIMFPQIEEGGFLTKDNAIIVPKDNPKESAKIVNEFIKNKKLQKRIVKNNIDYLLEFHQPIINAIKFIKLLG